MRIGSSNIKDLQKLLARLYNLNLTDEQAQQAGVAILRFAITKQLIAKNEHQNETEWSEPSTTSGK